MPRRRRDSAKKIDEHNFAELDPWASGLRLEDGRSLTSAERKEHERARRVGPGRPPKPPGEKAGRYLVSMDPALHDAAVKFSRSAHRSLSRLIAEALAERIDFKSR
jgi:hypothetical protein